MGEAAPPVSVPSDLPDDFVGSADRCDLGNAFIGATAGAGALHDIETGDAFIGAAILRQ